jgi:hypothetical protein
MGWPRADALVIGVMALGPASLRPGVGARPRRAGAQVGEVPLEAARLSDTGSNSGSTCRVLASPFSSLILWATAAVSTGIGSTPSLLVVRVLTPPSDDDEAQPVAEKSSYWKADAVAASKVTAAASVRDFMLYR